MGASVPEPVCSTSDDFQSTWLLFFFFPAQAVLTKPPEGLRLSCEFIGHLQLFPGLEAAALPLRRPAARQSSARREFNCKAPSAGSQGVKSKFTHIPWHPSARQSQRRGERGRRNQIAADSLPGSRGMLDVDCSRGLHSNPCALQREMPLKALLSPKRCFNLVLPSRHLRW